MLSRGHEPDREKHRSRRRKGADPWIFHRAAHGKGGGAWDLYELLPAFIVALAAIVIVSLLTKAPEQELVEEFEAVQAECKR